MPGNQTREEWLALPEVASNENALGTGLVLARPKTNKEFIDGVTYDGMLKIDEANNLFAFAWVPHVVASYGQLRSANCGDARCVHSCKLPGCLCDQSIGRCV